MKVTLIGSNGLLADSIGKYCNACDIELIVWGLNEPTQHKFAHFNKIDLISEHIDIKPIIDSNLIIYAVGAGIQSDRKSVV